MIRAATDHRVFGAVAESLSSSIDLVWLGPVAPPSWPLGNVRMAEASPAGIRKIIDEQLAESSAVAWLFWDQSLGVPRTDRVAQALERRGDVWHAGLALGQGGLPGLMNFVHPTWMFNRDPPASIESTSWRVTLRACLARVSVLEQLGGPEAGFRTLEAASLEFGHRCLTQGALTRHIPSLVLGAASDQPQLPLEDEALFIHRCHGSFWSGWALARAVMTGYASLRQTLGAWQVIGHEFDIQRRVFTPSPPPALNRLVGAQVSVIIPTLNRYSFLRVLLEQLRKQTEQCREIIIADQTAPNRRADAPYGEFEDLPLRVLYLEGQGQSSARNAALAIARGHYVLFLDDDVEIDERLVEQHLICVNHSQADASCGVAHELGALPLPDHFRLRRPSDVFPTNNSLAVRDTIRAAGSFDPTFDRHQNEDHDLGMRMYLSGAVMMLQPEIEVFHHHAPIGGLRAFGTRRITYGSSRQRLLHRHLPSVSELYLALRYFNRAQLREMVWLRVLGTASMRGSPVRRLLKLVVAAAFLPDSWLRTRSRVRAAEALLERNGAWRPPATTMDAP